MDATDLARWQFAITTVYHFLFVPITIGMSLIVAVFHTAWVRTHNPQWMRLAKFFGKLFLINFALGLVTGIVQEFQFGMNWSDYSRFVGDIFGAPLAFEALLAFFLESTFLGIWIFGWGRVPEKLHVGAIWMVHIGTVLSAYFILAANSFMQNPVGYRFNPATGRAEMADFWAVLTNKVQLVTFPHVILSAYMVGGAVVMGVALWLMRKHAGTGDEPMYRKATKFGAIFALVASLGVIVTGDIQGKIMTEVQPMKMAAAEGLYDTKSSAPIIPVTYWSFRIMMGLGFLTMFLAAVTLWAIRKGRVPTSKWWLWVAVIAPLAPVFANSFGWIFTEVGRQPWIVYGLMTTSTGVSPSVSTGEVWFSMIAYTLVYAVLAVIEVKLFLTYVRRGADPFEEPVDPASKGEDAPLEFAY